MIPTLTNTGILYRINRDRHWLEVQIQKRKAIGYMIKILVVIVIGAICWHFHPVPSFDKGEPKVQSTMLRIEATP